MLQDPDTGVASLAAGVLSSASLSANGMCLILHASTLSGCLSYSICTCPVQCFQISAPGHKTASRQMDFMSFTFHTSHQPSHDACVSEQEQGTAADVAGGGLLLTLQPMLDSRKWKCCSWCLWHPCAALWQPNQAADRVPLARCSDGWML